ncbi:MAG TPA: peptidoglycan DD-metalloendopeptidase family protein [Candidatus Enterenecus avicola]|nr:peptidoglycan DD-metalloendopeptidase family protein [Candidatus Enterenecus avicola]
MKKTGVRIFVLLLAAVMILSVLMPAMTTLAGAVTAGDIQDYKDSLQDVQDKKGELEDKLDALQDDKDAAEEKLSLLQEQILLTEQQIGDSQKLLDSYDQQIADKQSEITQLEEQEDQQYEEFYAQTRWMEENGGTSFISIIFQASSFSELLDYLMLVTDIMNYNDRIITQLEETQSQLAQARDDLQAARDGQAATQAKLESAKADLTSQKADADQYYQELLNSEESYNSEVAQLQAEEDQIQADLKEAQKKYDEQLAAQEPAPPPSTGGGSSSNPVVDPSGNWYWPLPGYYYISSVFGGRYHPITGVWESHTGTDVPAPGGTPIQCAKDGIVTTSQYNPSYGNYCIIYHGNGYATLYAHMRALPSVKVGESVTAGQVIGYVGTTGSSTGNHLHFELRINGQRASALDLYPNLSFSGL